ncbi:Cullin-4 [Thoreauomyces humboldtii]|nr:Cullin-4 [Thoreauomyces humboldtii]
MSAKSGASKKRKLVDNQQPSIAHFATTTTNTNQTMATATAGKQQQHQQARGQTAYGGLARPATAAVGAGESRGLASRNAAESVSHGRLHKAPPKKLVIRSFDVKPKLPPNFIENTWIRLEQAVRAIQASQSVTDGQEELYRACENLCHHQKSDEIYQKLRAVCDDHVSRECERVLASANTTSILAAVETSWRAFCQQMISIRMVFLYLDRTYVLHNAGLRSLWDMGLDLYREKVMDTLLPVNARVVEALLHEIKRDRDGELVDRPALRSHLRMFTDLSIYFTGFDPAFREESDRYYAAEGNRLMGTAETGARAADVVGNYLSHVDTRLADEAERCGPSVGYLDVGSRKALIAIVENTLLKKHAKTILEYGFAPLVNAHRLDDLKRMYSLFNRVGLLKDLQKAFSSYIVKFGDTIVIDPARDSSMVEGLLAFRTRISDIIQRCYGNSELFQQAMKESFEGFINHRQNRPAELIAKWVDTKLKTKKGVSDDELEAGLDKCLELFRYIQGKDVFEAFYKKDLAKRLLLQQSTSVDAEKSMLSKLKIECGPGFTSKLEGMFKDIDISRDYMTSFKEACLWARGGTPSSKFTDQLGPIELGINVLTHGYWPTYTPVLCNLPAELSKCQEVFTQFYMSKHNGRRLAWQNTLGTALLKGDFDKGPKELTVSLFQSVVLLLFNDSPVLTFAEIVKLTNLETAELTRTLQSLAMAKTRVLTITNRTPKAKDLLPTDTFAVNARFENPLHRIKINQIQLKETVEERDATETGVFQDRQYSVDAAIVRIMKSRKTITHVQLIADLIANLKFVVQPVDLKKRIESLIDREYLERDAKDPNVYIYLA